MRAVLVEHADAAFGVAEDDQVLAEHARVNGRAVSLGDLLDETCRDPVPAHDLAHRGLALDAAEQVVFLAGQHAALRGAACDT